MKGRCDCRVSQLIAEDRVGGAVAHDASCSQYKEQPVLRPAAAPGGIAPEELAAIRGRAGTDDIFGSRSVHATMVFDDAVRDRKKLLRYIAHLELNQHCSIHGECQVCRANRIAGDPRVCVTSPAGGLIEAGACNAGVAAK